MPFSKTSDSRTEDYWNEHFSDFIRARLVEVTQGEAELAVYEWSVTRSSTIRGGPLNYEIVWDLMNANIVIADLTDLNPNVLYELGIRHTLTAARGSGRTLLIQDEAAFKLPFDFANYAVMKYRHDKVATWKQELAERLRGCLAAPQYRDNPASMTFAQHDFSFQDRTRQEQQTANLKAAFETIERMTQLGFEVKWIQELVGRSVGRPPGQSSGELPKSG